MSEIIKDLNFLHQVSSPVENVDEAKSIIKKLEDTLRKHPNGIGLSAIQIGIPKRISVIKYGKHDLEFIRLINPEFIDRGESFTFRGEGCLSFPEVFMETQRLDDFCINNDAIDGDKFVKETLSFSYPGYDPEDQRDPMDKYESIAVEHEMDHLDGKTILDYGKPISPLIPITRDNPKIQRNAPCPCGSGKKYKKCCLNKS